MDLNYFRVGFADAAQAGPNLGLSVCYHPPPPNPAEFAYCVAPVEAGMLHGETIGLVHRPFGAISASLYARGTVRPRLYFDLVLAEK